ncbi:hypothetical protein HNR35_000912 [Borreliella spielmanii]|uniref:Outer surface protein n=1 Tax=Borreliella spielmanii TaxID=88916 RepID=A0ABR6P7E6_9SPIR|nr:complement regulator-acquiring protein [Borreliella spielmanii]MBB6031909.1 hypothetical protein [Borreliella spielmanii]
MKIKSLIHLKFIALFLSSCTIDANLNEDYKNKVEELLNSTTNDQTTPGTKTNSSALQLQTKTNTNKKAEQVAGLQNQPLANGQNLHIVHHNANPANRANPTGVIKKNVQTKAQITPPKQIAPTPTATATATATATVRKGTKTTTPKNFKKPQKYTFNYGLGQSTQTNFINQQNNTSMIFKQAQPSFIQTSSAISKSRESKNDLLRRISEEKNKIQNNNGFRETYDQFKMKDSAFELLDVISNISVFDRSYAPQLNSNTPEAENERNKFYAIMDFDQSKTTQFGSIMEILYKENQNHSLIRSLIISGLGIQISLEHALEELEKKIEIFNEKYSNNKITGFDFDTTMKEFELILNSILTERNEWSKQVDALIANANSNTSLNDSSTLAQYIQTRYLDKMENARQSVLDSYIRITEFK